MELETMNGSGRITKIVKMNTYGVQKPRYSPPRIAPMGLFGVIHLQHLRCCMKMIVLKFFTFNAFKFFSPKW